MLKFRKLAAVIGTTAIMALAGLSTAVYAEETTVTQTEQAETTESETTETEKSEASDKKGPADSASSETENAGGTVLVGGSHEQTKKEFERESAKAGPGASASEPEPETEPEPVVTDYLGVFNSTAYCPCAKCCGNSTGLTYTGTYARSRHTIAVDPSVIPLGSRVRIGDTIYTAEDIGYGVDGKHVDIFFDTHSEALRYGMRNVEVYRVAD